MIQYFWNWRQLATWAFLLVVVVRAPVVVLLGLIAAAQLVSPVYHLGWLWLTGRRAPHKTTRRLAFGAFWGLAGLGLAAVVAWLAAPVAIAALVGAGLYDGFYAARALHETTAGASAAVASASDVAALLLALSLLSALTTSLFQVPPTLTGEARVEMAARARAAGAWVWPVLLGVSIVGFFGLNVSLGIQSSRSRHLFDVAGNRVEIIWWFGSIVCLSAFLNTSIFMNSVKRLDHEHRVESKYA